jgi:hypothetical protein
MSRNVLIQAKTKIEGSKYLVEIAYTNSKFFVTAVKNDFMKTAFVLKMWAKQALKMLNVVTGFNNANHAELWEVPDNKLK